MKDWIEFVKKEFPNKAIDISESLQLLKETISSTMDDINIKLNEAFAERDFPSMEKYSLTAKETHEYELKIGEIIDFIDMEDLQIQDEIDEEIDKQEILNYDEYKVDHNVEHTLYDDFTHKRPYAFKINEYQLTKIKTWQDMLINTCEILIGLDEEKLLKFENNKAMNGKKKKYFSISPNQMRNPKIVSNKIYVETNQSANSIRNLIIKLLKEYEIKISEYKVFFRADYTNITK